MRRSILPIAASAAMSLGLLTAGPASAQTTQQGLVNVNVSDTTVQVPIAAAVNVCDLTIAALAQVIDDAGSCDAVAGSDAQAGPRGPSNVTQDGLVNVNVSGVIIQVPAAVAANICDVNVAVLAELVDEGGTCDAHAGSEAGA